ncbi:MAG: serine hydrolase [Bacteroidales bacterium]
MKKHFLGLFLTGLCFSSLYAQNYFIPDSIDAFIEKGMIDWDIPGVAVAVVKDGKVVHLKGYGLREVGKPEKVDENTIFAIASNSKAFTATSLANLQYQGKLSLDDKITKWMPDFQLKDKLALREVTIRDMLCHRIGFETFQGDFCYWDSKNTRQEIIYKMRFMEPKYSFRAQYGYCNSAYLTAGEIIPLAAKDTTWDDYLKHHFFKPMRMNRTFSTFPETMKQSNLAQPHQITYHIGEKSDIAVIPWGNADNLGPAASINSSAKDMANWLLMQLDSGRYEGKRIVPYPVLAETRKPQIVSGEVNRKRFPMRHYALYGLGWETFDYGGRAVYRHTGGADGFGSLTAFVPEDNFGVVVLTNNVQNSLFQELLYQLLDFYRYYPPQNWHNTIFKNVPIGREWELKEEKKKEDSLRTAHLPMSQMPEKYLGNYTHELYGAITVKMEYGKMFIHFSAHPTMTGYLEHLSGDTFKCTFSSPVMGKCLAVFNPKGRKIQSVQLNVDPFVDSQVYLFKRK